MSYSVLSYLDNAVKSYGEKIAYKDSTAAMTFSEIDKLSDRIATYLIQSGYHDQPVSIMVNRNVKVPAYYLGIAKAACFYAPMESDLPAHRLDRILSVVSSEIMLVESVDYEKACTLEYSGKIVTVEDIIDTQVDEKLLADTRKKIVDTMPLYVIFTSGSSGVPKGVITSHQAVTTYLDAVDKVLGLTSDDVIANQSPLDYIAAIRDIYLPLKTGAATVIIPKNALAMPNELYSELTENNVTTLCWSAAGLEVCVKIGLFEMGDLSCVNKVLFSGSVLHGKYLKTIQKALPEALLINQYGPTETTASCTYHVVTEQADDDTVLPIGVPYDNYSVFILNDDDKLADINEIGEICVGGPAVALGYYASEKTKESFVQNPLNDKYREIIYRTGDLGKLSVSGEFEFCGRKDRQIKHMGHRIELDEIDAGALEISGVDECLSLYKKDKELLYLFYSGDASPKEVTLYFRGKYPAYMIPRRIVKMIEMPHLANGKINAAKIKEDNNM